MQWTQPYLGKKEGFKRSGRSVPTNRKVSLLIGNSSKEAQALFPSVDTRFCTYNLILEDN